jgi:hypothetical protein
MKTREESEKIKRSVTNSMRILNTATRERKRDRRLAMQTTTPLLDATYMYTIKQRNKEHDLVFCEQQKSTIKYNSNTGRSRTNKMIEGDLDGKVVW